MKQFERILLIVSASGMLVGFAGCGPNRAQWMSRAAKNQATVATEDMGKPDEVRLGAKEEAVLLNGVATTIYGNLDKYSPQERAANLSLAQSCMVVASGLQTIADSRTDAGFTNAVFAMCTPERRSAEPPIAQLELTLAAGFNEGKIGSGGTSQQRAEAVAMLTTFGNTMVSIPARCDQAEAQMAEAGREEQQAEINHQANVSRALTAAAIVFAGTAIVAGEVGAAAATRPPVQNNYYYVNENNGY